MLCRICSRLINASCLHSEPWVAQAWLVLSSKDWIANVGAVHRHLKKVRPSQHIHCGGSPRGEFRDYDTGFIWLLALLL